MGIEITTEPIDVTVNGVTFNMLGDPTASPEWDALMEVEVFYTGPKADASRKELIEALAGLAETETDAVTIRSLKDGTKVLWRVAMAYIGEVTGFPTQPPASSTKRSKGTSTT